jgi:hypothetical protein
LNGPKSNGKAKGGEGNDNIAGDKGSLNGDPYANSYYGSGMGQEMQRMGIKWTCISSRGKRYKMQ